MNYIITNNPLDELAFKENLDFQTLENILECLDHVTPNKSFKRGV